MTTRQQQSVTEMRRESKVLEMIEHLVKTNSGTYSAMEAYRCIGVGDPAFADRNVYETVGGVRRETGPDAADAPGRMRAVGYGALSADRRRLADLHAAIARATRGGA